MLYQNLKIFDKRNKCKYIIYMHMYIIYKITRASTDGEQRREEDRRKAPSQTKLLKQAHPNVVVRARLRGSRPTLSLHHPCLVPRTLLGAPRWSSRVLTNKIRSIFRLVHGGESKIVPLQDGFAVSRSNERVMYDTHSGMHTNVSVSSL